MDYNKLLDQYKQLEKDFVELVIKSKEACSYCKNKIECRGEECEKYIESVDCWSDKRCCYDWAWSCKDFHFGTCDILKDTPCNGCIRNNYKNFEWRGSDV